MRTYQYAQGRNPVSFSYSAVREHLRNVRYWLVRAQALTVNGIVRKNCKRAFAFAMRCAQEALSSADYWRKNARHWRTTSYYIERRFEVQS